MGGGQPLPCAVTGLTTTLTPPVGEGVTGRSLNAGASLRNVPKRGRGSLPPHPARGHLIQRLLPTVYLLGDGRTTYSRCPCQADGPVREADCATLPPTSR